MMRINKKSNQFSRMLFLLVFCLVIVLLVSACNSSNEAAVETSTIGAAPTETLRPTATQTLVPTVPSPEDIAPQEIGKVGKGLMGDVYYSNDGSMLAYLEGNTIYWVDVNTGEVLGSDTGEYESDYYSYEMTFSEDNAWLIVHAGSGVLISTTSGKVYDRCESSMCYSRREDFRFSPDYSLVASVGDNHSTGGAYDDLGVYDIDNDEWYILVSSMTSNYHTVGEPAIDPGNQIVAAAYSESSDYQLRAWDIFSEEMLYAVSISSWVNSLDFSQDSEILVAGTFGGVLQLHNAQTGELLRIISGFPGAIRRVRFIEDDTKLRVSFANSADQIYDFGTGQITEAPVNQDAISQFITSKHKEGWADGSDVLFSPVDNLIAIGGSSIQVWDVAEERVVAALENPYGALIGWAFSPEGNRIAGVTFAGDVLVWDIASESLVLAVDSDILSALQVVYATNAGRSQIALGEGIYATQGISFSPDGTQIVFGNGTAVEVWDIASGETAFYGMQPEDEVYTTAVSYSADGTKIYTITNRNKDAQVWDAKTGELIEKVGLPLPDPYVYSYAVLYEHYFARNNYYEEDDQYVVELWNLETGEMRALPISGWGMQPIKFSPDGSLLFGQADGKLYVWETVSGNLVSRSSFRSGYASTMTMNGDNTLLAYGENGIAQLLDISTLSQAVAAQNYTTLTPELAEESRSPEPTSTPSGNLAEVFAEPSTLSANAISPDNVEALTEENIYGSGILEDLIWMPSAEEGQYQLAAARSVGVFTYSNVREIEPQSYYMAPWMETVAVNRNGDLISAGVLGDIVQVWNVSAGELLAEFAGWSPLALSPDARLIAYSGNDSGLTVYDLEVGAQIAEIQCLYASCKQSVFSPDSQYLAVVNGYSSSLGDHHYAQVWDIQAEVIVNSFGGLFGGITDIAFSADSAYLVGAEGGAAWIGEIGSENPADSISLYDPTYDGNLKFYYQSVNAVALSPDGEILALGDSEGSIWLYERETRTLIRKLENQGGAIQNLSFSPDGTRLLYIDVDGIMVMLNNFYATDRTRISSLPNFIHGMKYSFDDVLIAWGERNIWNIDPSSGELVDSVTITDGAIFDVTKSNQWIAVSRLWTMAVFSTETGGVEQNLYEEAPKEIDVVHYAMEGRILPGFFDATFSQNGNELVTLAFGGRWKYVRDAENIFRLEQYDEIGTSYIVENDAYMSVPSMDGKYRAIAMGYVYLELRSADGELFAEMEFPEEKYIIDLAISPDNRLIAVGFDDGTILFVDVEKWAVVHQIDAHVDGVTALAFTSDGLTLTSTGWDGVLRFWGIE